MDTYYFKIEVEKTKRGIDWSAVYKAAGSEAGRLILPYGVVPPKGCGVIAYDTTAFLRRVMINGVAEIAETAATRGSRISIALLDREANCPWIVPRLIGCSQTVYIITARKNEYDDYADHIFELTGARPVICSTPNVIENCDIVLAPFGFSGYGMLKMCHLAFSGDGIGGISICDEDIDLDGYDLQISSEYNVVHFAAALCERARIKLFEDTLPKKYYSFGKGIFPQELVNKICTLDIKDENNYNSSIIEK